MREKRRREGERNGAVQGAPDVTSDHRGEGPPVPSGAGAGGAAASPRGRDGAPPPAAEGGRGRAPRSRSAARGGSAAEKAARLAVSCPETLPPPLRAYLADLFSITGRWMGLGHYDVLVQVEDRQPEDAEGPLEAVLFSVESDPSYQWARMTVFPAVREWWDGGDCETLVRSAIHEWVHVLLEPVVADAWAATPSVGEAALRAKVEAVVETVAKVVFAGFPRRGAAAKLFRKEAYGRG